MPDNKIQLINFLKGFAIFTIVLMHLLMKCHFHGVLGQAIMFGGAGVHVFILCSGFGLRLSSLNKPLTYGIFLKRRFTKVYNPYVIMILVWSLWILLTKHSYPLIEVSSHAFLWKMFSTEYHTSLCYPYWFISTIIQFYIAWPVIAKLMSYRCGLLISIVISLIWSSIVGYLGYEDMRPWGSCFLQYLWEFCLGIILATKYHLSHDNGGVSKLLFIENYKLWWLVLGAVLGCGIMLGMSKFGGILKLYNDIPSLLGYLSCALLVYKVGKSLATRFFCWINGFGYELYLVHSLMFAIVTYCLKDFLPLNALLPICLIVAFVAANAYSALLKIFKLK